jgi:hypothetical protein
MLLCNESPRWLARQDNWEKAGRVLSITRNLPEEHPYIIMEMTEMRDQLDLEVISNLHYSDSIANMSSVAW